jgi:hypothetical protein
VRVFALDRVDRGRKAGLERVVGQFALISSR